MTSHSYAVFMIKVWRIKTTKDIKRKMQKACDEMAAIEESIILIKGRIRTQGARIKEVISNLLDKTYR